jgi:hypothetical protein
MSELSYRELQKEVADKTDINPVGKKKQDLIEILEGLEESGSEPEPRPVKKPISLPKPQKDFSLMTWEEGRRYIKWAAEEVGYNPAELKAYFRLSGFVNYSTPKFDEIYTTLSKEKYMNDLIKRKIHQ